MRNVSVSQKALRESLLRIALCENEVQLPTSLPVSPSQHSSTQLSVESPNVEDVNFVPTSQEVLGLALQKWSSVIDVNKIPEFYRNFLKFLDTQIQEEE